MKPFKCQVSVGVLSKLAVQTGIFPSCGCYCLIPLQDPCTLKPLSLIRLLRPQLRIYGLLPCSKHSGKINEGIDSQVMSFAQVCVCVGACTIVCVCLCLCGRCKRAAGLHKTGAINQQSSAKITQMGAFLSLPPHLSHFGTGAWGCKAFRVG